MASRKDLLKAQGFTSQRLVKALVVRSPDDLDSPLRRSALGIFASIMIGVLITAAFGVIGLLHPGKSAAWRKDNTVVIDKQTGVVFAYIKDGLYPAYNIASAKLATGGGETAQVNSKSLAGVARQQPIGIATAPAELPDPGLMNGYPIRVCSTSPTAAKQRFTTVEIGESVPTPTVNADVAVRAGNGQPYLVHDGQRFAIPDHGNSASELLVGLKFPQTLPATPEFVSSLPDGPELAPPKIPGAGTAAAHPVGGATAIGTVLHTTDSDRWYVLLSDGVAYITPLQARELQYVGHAKVVPTDTQTVTGAPSRTKIPNDDGAPADLPDPSQQPADMSGSAICATWAGPGQQPLISFPEVGGTGLAAAGNGRADQVTMPQGTGALVQTLNASDRGNVTLVTGGKAYPIADDKARAALGYAKTSTVRLPPSLITILPSGMNAGQTLSISAASPPCSGSDCQ